MNKVSMKRVSAKASRRRRQERLLSMGLLVRAGGRCEICGEWPDWRGLSKHEKIKRSQGGDPLDPENCEMLCGRCHSAAHRIKEVK